MKRIIQYILLCMAAAIIAFGCQKGIFVEQTHIPEGYIPINVRFSAPDMLKVNTRAADPDGKGVNKMTLFCFDNYGMFITHVDNVQIAPDPGKMSDEGYSLGGQINEVLVPENTRRIHFLANQNLTSFKEEDFIGKTEQEVVAKLEGSSGMVIYWGYFSAYGPDITDAQKFLDALEEAHGEGKTPIRLLRNQARFEVPSNVNFTVTGFTVVNTCAFGTVAPFHPQKGFNFTTILTTENGKEEWAGTCDWTTTDFITLPNNTTRLSPPEDVDIASETAVFETDNKSSDPVSIIIKGKHNNEESQKYYRVILMDEEGNYIKVRRNFLYTINIAGKLSYGQETFEAALTAPASNNIWLSINDEVGEVSDKTYTLKVNETSVELLATPVMTGETITGWTLSKPNPHAAFDLNEPGGSILHYELDLGYYLTKNSGTITQEDKPVLEWADGCEISNQSPINDFMLGNSGNYNEATVVLDNLDGLKTKQTITGTVIIKKGHLQRKIKISILKALDFTPVWVSTQVNADAGENLTLLFTIPDECPDELLPFDVYISAANVDVRHIPGMEMPIITYQNNPQEYGQDTYARQEDETLDKPIGYKYVYTVTQKGDQRIYFSNLIDRENYLNEWITIESPFFNTVKKTITFNNSAQYRITMPGLQIYNSRDIYDEDVKYMLVPQKKGAQVDLGLVFSRLDNNTETNIKAGENDEFFLYSEFLSHLNGHGPDTPCNCQFEDFHKDLWGSGGRIHAFRFKNANEQNFPAGSTSPNGYLIHMITDRAKSKEVVRISSNQPGSEQAFLESTTGTYGNENTGERGRGYRSLIFELDNYRPFHFAAEVNGDGTIISGQQEEITDNIELKYGPDNPVTIEFDITSFKAEDNTSVDPFGTKFYVYIVAPMLNLAENTEKLSKLKDGVFAYKVGASRKNEKDSCQTYLEGRYSAGEPENNDETYTGDKSGERKKVVFQRKNAVTKGEIILTTDPVLAGVDNIEGHSEQIAVFYDKKFKLSNSLITGTIQRKEGETLMNMTANAFISFALEKNNSRIGSMVIHAADAAHDNKSWYELSLRPEYSFNWNEDNLIITHTHRENSETENFKCDTGTRKPAGEDTYKFTLKELSENPNIVLIKQYY